MRPSESRHSCRLSREIRLDLFPSAITQLSGKTGRHQPLPGADGNRGGITHLGLHAGASPARFLRSAADGTLLVALVAIAPSGVSE